jgi:tetratricopeptide (TPR) repeat protein
LESQRKFPYESAADAISAGLQHHSAGRLDEADKLYRQVLVREPNHPDALHLLGVIYGQRGQPETAVDLISRALKVRPDEAQFHCRLAENLRALRRYQESIASFRRAIELADNDPTIHNSFGAALGEMRQFDLAIEQFRRAIEIKKDFADAHSNLGAALVATGALDDAIAALQIALQLNPRSRGAHNNLGNALYNKGRIRDAITIFDKIAAASPDDPRIHANLALAHLLLGDFARGWREHEWRLNVPQIVGTRRFAEPRWDGGDLDGKTILLHPEQGFGDTIQFARFVPRVAALGGRVILESPAELFRLFEGFPGVTQLVRRDQPLPHFDVQSPLLSLGSVFNVTVETIPAQVPYLKSDPQLAEQWGQRFGADDKRFRVGLVWAGRPEHTNERNRSMKLAQFSPLASLELVAFYSLQKGAAAAQAADLPAALRLIDWTADLTDFAETAALIEHLDLILTVDTAVAHLAGAMGKRVRLLLPWIPDWRWMLERTDSPWYPTMRLFRQAKIGNWAEVVERVVNSLRNEKRS